MALGNREVGIELRARDMASQALASVGSGLGTVGGAAAVASQNVGLLGKLLGPVAQGMQLAFGFSVAQKIAQGLNVVKDAAIDFNAKLEQWRIAFKQTLGSAKAADEFIANMKEFAAKTPFEMPGLVDAAQKLTGAGMAAKDVIPTLTALGDAIAGAGKGQEYVISATNSLTKMMRAGRVTGESMMYLTESGVNAWAYLAKALGKSIPETQKLVTKGQVDANTALKAIRDGVAESDLGGMMDVQSKTFNGALSTINDQLRNVIADGFKPFFDVLRDGALKIGEFLQSPAWTDWGPRVAGALSAVVAAVKDPVTAFRTLVKAIKDAGGPLAAIRDIARDLRNLAISKIGDGFDVLAGKIASFAGAVPDFADVLGPLSRSFLLFSAAFKNMSDYGMTFAEQTELWRVGAYNLQEGLASLTSDVLNGIAGGFRFLAGSARLMIPSLQGLEPILSPLTVVLWKISEVFDTLSKGDISGAMVPFLEAMGSLQGIVDGAYKALDNFLIGVGPALESAVGGFMEWIDTSLPKVMDSAIPLIETMITYMAGQTPRLADTMLQWAGKLIDWISPAIPKVLEQLSVLGQQLFDWVIKTAPEWLNQLIAMGDYLVTWITDRVPDALAALRTWAQSLFDWIVNTGVPTLASSLGPMVLTLVDWVFEALPKLLDALDEIIGTIIGFIVDNGPTLIGKLLEWAGAFIGWITTEVIPRLLENLPTIIRTILLFLGGAAGKLVGKLGEIGSSMVGKFIGLLGKLPGKAGEVFGTLIAKIGSFVGSIVAKAGEIGSKFLDGVVGFVVRLPGKIANVLLDAIQGVINFVPRMLNTGKTIATNFVKGILDNLAGLPGKIGELLSGLFKTLFSKGLEIGPLKITSVGLFLAGQQVASFDVGSWNVPKDMPAVVHEGEMIIPASVAAAIRSMAGRTQSQGPAFPTTTVAPGTLAGNAASVSAGNSVTIVNNFGRDSVRSDDDIHRISKELAVQARLQGLTPTLRAVGSSA